MPEIQSLLLPTVLPRADAMKSCGHNETAEDRAVLDAIPYGLMTGHRLDEVLRLIGKMDQRLVEEHRRLRGEAEQQKVALRSGPYAACYVSRGWENFAPCGDADWARIRRAHLRASR
jgi:hypothetical protein